MRCTIGHHLNFTSVALIFYAASRHACDDDASKPDDDGDASKPYASSSFVQLVVLGLAVVLVGALAVVSAVVWAVVLGMVILPSDHHHAHIDSPA